MGSGYKRSIEELKKEASFFWPEELSDIEAESSIIPKLIATQDQFISILSIETDSLDDFFKILTSSKLSPNLFLKHLVVLSDFGGEMLQRINNQFNSLFQSGTLNYFWNNEFGEYKFKQLPIKGTLSNDKLGISGKKLLQEKELSELQKDIIILLLLGNSCIVEHTSQILDKCVISHYLGKPEKLNKFIKERYIWVSRITGGAKSNNLGQITQSHVISYLKLNLGINDIQIHSNGNIPIVSHSKEESKLTTFDIVVNYKKKYVAIEISFQVTTNSVIERKAGQAMERFRQIEKSGNKIAYLIDGAGNFQRESAVSTICSFSHCTIAFSNSELDKLCEFIMEFFNGKI